MAELGIRIRTGDTLPWKFTIRDETGAPVDLTGGSATISMRKRGQTTNWVDGVTVTVTSAADGLLTYAPTGTDVMNPGTYDLELAITDSNSKVQHTPPVLVSIEEALN